MRKNFLLIVSLIFALLCSLFLVSCKEERSVVTLSAETVSKYTFIDLSASYERGERVSLSGGKLLVTLSDGSVQRIELTDEMLVGVPDTSSLGGSRAIVLYGGVEFFYEFAVLTDVVVDYEFAGVGAQYRGLSFYADDLTLTLRYEDGRTCTLPGSALTLLAPDLSEEGDATLVAEYRGKRYSVPFVVQENPLDKAKRLLSAALEGNIAPAISLSLSFDAEGRAYGRSATANQTYNGALPSGLDDRDQTARNRAALALLTAIPQQVSVTPYEGGGIFSGKSDELLGEMAKTELFTEDLFSSFGSSDESGDGQVWRLLSVLIAAQTGSFDEKTFKDQLSSHREEVAETVADLLLSDQEDAPKRKELQSILREMIALYLDEGDDRSLPFHKLTSFASRYLTEEQRYGVGAFCFVAAFLMERERGMTFDYNDVMEGTPIPVEIKSVDYNKMAKRLAEQAEEKRIVGQNQFVATYDWAGEDGISAVRLSLPLDLTCDLGWLSVSVHLTLRAKIVF